MVEDADTTGPICNTAKDKSKVKHHTAGIYQLDLVLPVKVLLFDA